MNLRSSPTARSTPPALRRASSPQRLAANSRSGKRPSRSPNRCSSRVASCPARTALVPAADGNTLSKTALPVPAASSGSNCSVRSRASPRPRNSRERPEINVENANTGKGIAAALPLKVKLDNPALGATCYVGSNSEPLVPELTTGTTNPPPPNKPITGNPGEVVIGGHGKIFTVAHSSLVDNAFSVPGANGCAEPLSLVVDPAVDLQVGLPAAAGENTAILNGTLEAAGARQVKAEAKLPELGRCEKVEGEGKGKNAVYNGAYVDSGCVEEAADHHGKYEWNPGPGAGNKFTASSAAVTLETVGKAKVKCVGSSSQGEYTGTKTATATVKLTGCTLASNGESCQSAGAGAGEIVAGGLSEQLGFIQQVSQGTEVLLSVGWDLKREPSIVSGECGSAKSALLITGSVIAPISAIDKMASSYTLKYAQSAGKQSPEAFEEQPKDTLGTSIGGGPAEQSGLKATEKVNNEEKLEVKAEAE